MKKPPLYLLFCFLAMSTSCLLGQDIFGGEKPANFFEMQAAFEKWSEGRDLSKEKGWKPYARWAYHWESRVLPDGSFPDPAHYLRAANDYQRLKQLAPERGSAWSPAGPFTHPQPLDPFTPSGVGRVNCVTFHPTDTNTLWIGTPNGGIWKSTDNGGSWIPLNEGLIELGVSDLVVNPQDPDEMYVATGDFDYFLNFLNAQRPAGSVFANVGGNGIYKTTDGGLSWNATGYNFSLPMGRGALVRRILVHPRHPDTLLAGGVDGIWRSEDGGDSWNQVVSDIVTDLEFHPSEPDRVYAASSWHWDVSSQAGVHLSTDFGENWTGLSSPIPARDTVVRIELAIAPTDSSHIYALAASFFGQGLHALYQSTDGGQSWRTQVTGDTLNLLGGAFDCPNRTFLGGQGAYDLSLLVDHRDKDRIFVGGIICFGSEDGGRSWGLLTNGGHDLGLTIHVDHHQAKSNPLTGQYYFCHDGGMHRTDTLRPVLLAPLIDCLFDSACNFIPACTMGLNTQWTNISQGIVNTEFYRIGLRESTEEVIGGTQDNGTFVNTNSQWRQVAIRTDGMEALLHPNSNNMLYATSQYGPLRRSEDGGATFTRNLSDTIASVENRGQWVTPYLMHPTDPNTLYAGFRNVWKSGNKGESWEKISNFPPEPTFASGLPKAIRDMEINPNQPTNIWVLKRGYFASNLPAEVHVTYASGSSWTDRSAGLPVDSLYANDLAIGNVLGQAWIAFSGFIPGKKVYFSRTGGQTWENISYNLPNVPINAIEYDPSSANNTVYIGTDLGIWYIHDGLTEWQPYSLELPLTIVNELEIDKQHGKIYAATYGRGLWVADLVQPNVGIAPAAIYQAEVRLSPNPNRGAFSLQIENHSMEQAELSIVDITGRTVHQETLSLRGQDVRIPIEKKLKPGHYFVRLSHQNRSQVLKMVVR